MWFSLVFHAWKQSIWGYHQDSLFWEILTCDFHEFPYLKRKVNWRIPRACTCRLCLQWEINGHRTVFHTLFTLTIMKIMILELKTLLLYLKYVCRWTDFFFFDKFSNWMYNNYSYIIILLKNKPCYFLWYPVLCWYINFYQTKWSKRN